MIILGDILPADQFLGCRHTTEKWLGADGQETTVHLYDMKKFMGQCAKSY